TRFAISAKPVGRNFGFAIRPLISDQDGMRADLHNGPGGRRPRFCMRRNWNWLPDWHVEQDLGKIVYRTASGLASVAGVALVGHWLYCPRSNLGQPSLRGRQTAGAYHLRPRRIPTLVNPRFSSQRLALDMWSTVNNRSHRADNMNPSMRGR